MLIGNICCSTVTFLLLRCNVWHFYSFSLRILPLFIVLEAFFSSRHSSILSLLLAAQSEDKVKPVRAVPGHLQALEHVVGQEYFPKENVAVLEAFMSR